VCADVFMIFCILCFKSNQIAYSVSQKISQRTGNLIYRKQPVATSK